MYQQTGEIDRWDKFMFILFKKCEKCWLKRIITFFWSYVMRFSYLTIKHLWRETIQRIIYFLGYRLIICRAKSVFFSLVCALLGNIQVLTLDSAETNTCLKMLIKWKPRSDRIPTILRRTRRITLTSGCDFSVNQVIFIIWIIYLRHKNANLQKNSKVLIEEKP